MRETKLAVGKYTWRIALARLVQHFFKIEFNRFATEPSAAGGRRRVNRRAAG